MLATWMNQTGQGPEIGQRGSRRNLISALAYMYVIYKYVYYYVYIYIYIYKHVYIYIYVYREREREILYVSILHHIIVHTCTPFHLYARLPVCLSSHRTARQHITQRLHDVTRHRSTSHRITSTKPHVLSRQEDSAGGLALDGTLGAQQAWRPGARGGTRAHTGRNPSGSRSVEKHGHIASRAQSAGIA